MIGYYAHSHGSGHCVSGQYLAKNLDTEMTIFTSKNYNFSLHQNQVIYLDTEDQMEEEYSAALKNLPAYAHYLPKSHSGIKRRVAHLLNSIIERNINLLLVDVSVEVAALVRLASTPYLYCRMMGYRDDLPHTIAYNSAEMMFAFYPQVMESNIYFEKYGSKTFYLGFISQYPVESKYFTHSNMNEPMGLKISIITGQGGTKINESFINNVAAMLPECQVQIVGVLPEGKEFLPNVSPIGIVENIRKYVIESDVVIASAGMNLTAEVLALKNKFICIAEDRPYEEQISIVKKLVEAEVAVEIDQFDIRGAIIKYLRLPRRKEIGKWFCNVDRLAEFQQKIVQIV